MRASHFSKDRPIEYFILVDPHADGPIIGILGDHPIAAAIKDGFGRRYTYVGVASRLRDGRYDVKSLSPGEWFADPGLVYRQDQNRPSRLQKFLHGPDADSERPPPAH
jgi:hypothetical protein